MRSRIPQPFVLLLTLLLFTLQVGCGSGSSDAKQDLQNQSDAPLDITDSVPPEDLLTDSAPSDSGVADSAPSDSGVADSGDADSGGEDSGVADSGGEDSSGEDSGGEDTQQEDLLDAPSPDLGDLVDEIADTSVAPDTSTDASDTTADLAQLDQLDAGLDALDSVPPPSCNDDEQNGSETDKNCGGFSVLINEVYRVQANTLTMLVAGPAGVTLSGWTIALYHEKAGGMLNGNLLDLSAVSFPAGSGYAEAWGKNVTFDYPDAAFALALVSPQGEVVQFVSFGFNLPILDGPAKGLTPLQVGALPLSLDFSWQLKGSGRKVTDFSWVYWLRSVLELNQGQAFRHCPACSHGKSCNTDFDCINRNCVNGSCGPCGDGKKDDGEECDDGNADNTDFCDQQCKRLCIRGDKNAIEGDSCYMFFDGDTPPPLSFSETLALCQSHGATLVTIDSQGINELIAGFLPNGAQVMLAINDRKDEGVYVWNPTEQITTSVVYSNFSMLSPNSQSLDCVMMVGDGVPGFAPGVWVRVDCDPSTLQSVPFQYVCEYRWP